MANILKKANIERSKQRLARMGLRQRSHNKTEKNHDREMSKLRLAYMGLRQKSQNNNNNNNAGDGAGGKSKRKTARVSFNNKTNFGHRGKYKTRTKRSSLTSHQQLLAARKIMNEIHKQNQNKARKKMNNTTMGGRRKKKTRRNRRKKRGGRPYVGAVSAEANRYWRNRREREDREREAREERERQRLERERQEAERRERARIMSRAGQLFPNRNFTLEEAKNAVETHNIHRRIMYNVIPEATEVQNAVEFDGGKIRSMMASKAEPVLTGIPMATVVGNRIRVGGKRKTKKRRKK